MQFLSVTLKTISYHIQIISFNIIIKDHEIIHKHYK